MLADQLGTDPGQAIQAPGICKLDVGTWAPEIACSEFHIAVLAPSFIYKYLADY